MKITRRGFLQSALASAAATVFSSLASAEQPTVEEVATPVKKQPTDLSYYAGSDNEWHRMGWCWVITRGA